MSFALEFRKKHFLEADIKAGRKGGTISRHLAGGVSRRVASRAETRASRAIALRALLIAAIVLAIFNSEGLRLSAYDLAESGFGRALLPVSEAWDGAMEHVGAKTLVANVRTIVGEAQEMSWADIAGIARAPAFAFRDRKGRGAPAQEGYTGALPTAAKHGLDDGGLRFNRSGAGGR
jgi:hypothetical protein